MLQSANLTPYELELRARCFYWTRKTKAKVDFVSYQSWKAAQSQTYATPSVDSLVKSLGQSTLTETASSASTQLQPESSPTSTTSAGEPPAPYPQNFAEVAEMITSGRGHLLPGIKDIPPIILAEKITPPTKELRKKPWEKDESPITTGGMYGDRRDIFIKQEL